MLLIAEFLIEYKIDKKFFNRKYRYYNIVLQLKRKTVIDNDVFH